MENMFLRVNYHNLQIYEVRRLLQLTTSLTQTLISLRGSCGGREGNELEAKCEACKRICDPQMWEMRAESLRRWLQLVQSSSPHLESVSSARCRTDKDRTIQVRGAKKPSLIEIQS